MFYYAQLTLEEVAWVDTFVNRHGSHYPGEMREVLAKRIVTTRNGA